MNEISPAALEALLKVVVAAIESLPHIIEAIETHGAMSDSSKASLIARATSARAKVDAYLANYEPHL